MKGKLILASQSPRRRDLLGVLDWPFTVMPAEIEEVPRDNETPQDFVQRVALEKAIEVSSRLSGAIVLSADTVVTLEGEIFGKPADSDDAWRMLRKLSGRRHSVYTAVCIINQDKNEVLQDMDRTEVWFDELSDDDIRECLRRENVMDKAGAYAIQGYAGLYIPKIEGNYFNVMGLPLPLVHRMLCRTLS